MLFEGSNVLPTLPGGIDTVMLLAPNCAGISATVRTRLPRRQFVASADQKTWQPPAQSSSLRKLAMSPAKFWALTAGEQVSGRPTQAEGTFCAAR